MTLVTTWDQVLWVKEVRAEGRPASIVDESFILGGTLEIDASTIRATRGS